MYVLELYLTQCTRWNLTLHSVRCLSYLTRIHGSQEIELYGLHCTVTVYGCKTLALLWSESFTFLVFKRYNNERNNLFLSIMSSRLPCVEKYLEFNRWWSSELTMSNAEKRTLELKNPLVLRIWPNSINDWIDLTRVCIRSTSLINHTTPILLPFNGFKIKEGRRRSWVMRHWHCCVYFTCF